MPLLDTHMKTKHTHKLQVCSRKYPNCCVYKAGCTLVGFSAQSEAVFSYASQPAFLLGLTFSISLYLARCRVMQKQNWFSSPGWQMLSLDASKLQIEDKQDSL